MNPYSLLLILLYWRMISNWITINVLFKVLINNIKFRTEDFGWIILLSKQTHRVLPKKEIKFQVLDMYLESKAEMEN